MFANAVSMAACRANLGAVMTVKAYDHATALAARFANRLRGTIGKLQLPARLSDKSRYLGLRRLGGSDRRDSCARGRH